MLGYTFNLFNGLTMNKPPSPPKIRVKLDENTEAWVTPDVDVEAFKRAYERDRSLDKYKRKKPKSPLFL